MLHRAKVAISLLIIPILVGIHGCGTGGGGNTNLRSVFGTLVDPSGSPVPGVEVVDSFNGLGTTTSDGGLFSLDTIILDNEFSLAIVEGENRTSLSATDVPDSPSDLPVEIEYDSEAQTARFLSIAGEEITPELPVEESTPLPSEEGEGEEEEEEPQGNFDSDGNTTAFGIPNGLVGNITRGNRKWDRTCASHHGIRGRNWKFGALRRSIAGPLMNLTRQDVPDRDLADITAYLNRRNN